MPSVHLLNIYMTEKNTDNDEKRVSIVKVFVLNQQDAFLATASG